MAPHRSISLFRTLLLAAGLSATPAAMAADASKPHPHQGVAPKFNSPKPSQLTAEEVTKLQAGQPVRKQVRYGDSGGRGVAIMDVKATPETIWSVILDFPKYPAWVQHLDTCEVLSKSGEKIKVHFIIKLMGLSVEYWIDHKYDKTNGSLTWQLDYTKESDLHDSTGYWLVYPAPDHPGYSRVEYTVDLRVSGWVPGAVEDLLAKKGLEQATTWVKAQSEAR
jgi:hypothetical protein